MNFFGLQIKQPHPAGRPDTASLLDDHAHRISFVHQAQASLFGRIFGVFRIHEDPTTHQDAMNICGHAGNPAHIKIARAHIRTAVFSFGDIALYRRLPEALVTGIDRKFAGVFRHLYVGMRQNKITDFTVERKTMRTFADCEHQHG